MAPQTAAPEPLHSRNNRLLPPPGTVLCTLADLGEAGAKSFCWEQGGDRLEIFVQRRGEQIVAYVNDCPHARLPLNWRPGRFLDRQKEHLLCANHGALFRIRDGYCVSGPCKGEYLTPVAVTVHGGQVRLAP